MDGFLVLVWRRCGCFCLAGRLPCALAEAPTVQSEAGTGSGIAGRS